MTELIEHVGRLAGDYLTSEAGKKVISDAVGRCVKSAVESATGYGSAFERALSRTVEAKLAIPTDFDMPAYHDYITKVVLSVVKDGLDRAVATQVEKRLQEILPSIPVQIRLSEILKEFRKDRKDQQRYGGSGDEHFTFHVKKTTDGFLYLNLDKRERTPEDRCDIRIGIYQSKIFSLFIGGRHIEQQLFVGDLYRFERFLFRLRAANTEIEVDLDDLEDVDTYVGHD